MKQFFLPILFFCELTVFCQSSYRFKHLTVDDGLSRNTVTAIIQDEQGFMWFGTFNGLNRYDGYSFEIYKTNLRDSTTISNNRIISTTKDKDGNIWFLTFDGVYNKYNYETDGFTKFKEKQLKEEFIEQFVPQVSVKESGDVVWRKIESGGLERYVTNTGEVQQMFHDPFEEYTLNDNDIRCMYLDDSNILWIGTVSGGVNMLDLNQKKIFVYKHSPVDENSLQSSNIRAISEDKNGNLWVGTHAGGICKIDRLTNSFTRIVEEDGLASNTVRDIYSDSKGFLWVGFSMRAVVQRIDPQTGKFVTFQGNPNDSAAYNDQSTYSILEDEYGFIWFGGFGGLSRYNPETNQFCNFKIFGQEPLMSSASLRVIYQDKSKNIWIGTEGGGLNKMIREFAGSEDEKITFQHLMHDPVDTNSLSDNRVYSICEDDDGMLWIGTALGLNRYDPYKKEFTVYTEEDGLPDVMIYGILRDNGNNLWLSHSNGITRFNTETNKIICNYRKSDGLQGNQFSEDAYYKSPNGEMFFGGHEGLTYFSPDSIYPNPILPKVVFTSFSVLNQNVEPGEEVLGKVILKKAISKTKKIELDYNHRVFSIEFAALHYSNPLNNKYEYKLQGFDEEWNPTDASKRHASYSNLRGGDYTFFVRASNSDNEWTREPISLQIHITPPFWQTWYFYIIVAVLLTVLVLLIIKQRENKLGKDKKILEAKIAASQEEINKQREEIVMQKQELKLRAVEEKDMRWYNEGLAKFSEIISKNKGNLGKFSQAIITKLVDYLGADQGGFFLINDSDEKNPFFELTGSFAYDGQKLKKKKVELYEGQIGVCYKEKKVVEINNLPETYTTVRSGLGKKSPRFLVIAPLKIDEEILGVLEIASFIRVKGVRIMFLEKLAENISAVLATERATEKMHVLYQKSKEQTEILIKKEEEMRQTLENLETANKEASDREEKLNAKLAEKDATIKDLKKKNSSN